LTANIPFHRITTAGGRRRGRKTAFTLIELLVVIAVIAILASLLLPVLEGAKLRTQQTQCSSDLRQMAIAYRMYLDDVGAFEFVSPPVQPPLFS
jgi:prepilin-type N-terminal cleavage/methylation domain-containing protein